MTEEKSIKEALELCKKQIDVAKSMFELVGILEMLRLTIIEGCMVSIKK